MFKLKALLALSIFCIPTFAVAGGYDDPAALDNFRAFGACISYSIQYVVDPETGEETDDMVHDTDDNIIYDTKWDDENRKCYVDLLEGMCKKMLATDPIYTQYRHKKFLDDGRVFPIPEPVNGYIYRCEIPGYTIDENGNYVKSMESNDSKKPVDPAFANIDQIIQNNSLFTKSSAWTDDNGGFNTARLVSDSVAGVVLGTVGGVVTSKIIKKNQLKKGMETFHCTIGGQDVASMGDEFNVGVQQ